MVREIEITQDGITEQIRGEWRSDKIYYCLESTVFTEIELFGCEVEVEEVNDKLLLKGIYKESPYVTHRFLRSKEYVESENGEKIKNKVIEAGGDWEQIAGGLFLIHLPREKDKYLSDIIKISE